MFEKIESYFVLVGMENNWKIVIFSLLNQGVNFNSVSTGGKEIQKNPALYGYPLVSTPTYQQISAYLLIPNFCSHFERLFRCHERILDDIW